jgi:hypothetical protein
MVRDFLFGLPRDAVFPPIGGEATSPLVKGAPAQPEPGAEAAGDEKDTGKDTGKDKDKKSKDPKRTGQIGVPARL